MRGRPKEGRHPNFKTGKTKTDHGYILVFVGKGHHLADVRGYAYEHRINAEKKLGRKLKKEELVHHKDENKTNNNEDNLEIFDSIGAHLHSHGKKNNKHPDEPNIEIQCACGCGTAFLKYDFNNRPRRYVSGHNTGHKTK
jgi:hypothetical protein